MATFGDTWRRVRLAAPGVPFGLVRNWTQDAYNALAARRPWSFTRVEYQIPTLAARSISVTFTQGSLNITSAALFVASDAGRQIRVGTFPLYTISVVTDASTATLDTIFSGVDGAQTAQILSAYVTMPADFGAFELITDPYNQRLISWWHTQEELGRLDPTRTSSDANPRALVSRGLSIRPATLGQVVYEWWPHPTVAKAFPCFYRQDAQDLADARVLTGVLGKRSDILETGALAECARWPGTAEQRNPYFNLQLAKTLKDDFERDCAHLELRDDDQDQQTWVAAPYQRWGVWDLYGDTSILRATDADISDYYGGGGVGLY
jgi:hypothetical protein